MNTKSNRSIKEIVKAIETLIDMNSYTHLDESNNEKSFEITNNHLKEILIDIEIFLKGDDIK